VLGKDYTYLMAWNCLTESKKKKQTITQRSSCPTNILKSVASYLCWGIKVKAQTKIVLVLLVIYFIFFFADVITTEIGFAKGFQEVNPPSSAKMNTYGRLLTYSYGALLGVSLGLLSFVVFEKFSPRFSKKSSLILDWIFFIVFIVLVCWILVVRIQTVSDNIYYLL